MYIKSLPGSAFLISCLIFCGGDLAAQQAPSDEDEESTVVESEKPQQDDVSKAMDSTATQWSFQFSWQGSEWKQDEVNGNPRPQGHDDFFQVRVVAPVVLETMTILPRLTVRHFKNKNTGKTGIGNSELFAIMIPRKWDWGTGRMGIGPLVTLPGDEDVARDEWGYGFAAGIVNTSGKWFYGLLFTQSWRYVDPDALPVGTSDTNPLGIAPFLNYQLGNGWYIGNGDQILQYDWDSREWYVPIGIRLGKVFVGAKGSWNLYAEWQTSWVYDSWPGAAKDQSFRINLSKTLPVGF
jgi:hypothetical protein